MRTYWSQPLKDTAKYLCSVFIFIFMTEIFLFLNRKNEGLLFHSHPSGLSLSSLYVAVLNDQCIFTALRFYWHLWYGMARGDYWPSSSLSDLHQSQKQDWCTTALNTERWVGTIVGQKGTPFWDTWASPLASRARSTLRNRMGWTLVPLIWMKDCNEQLSSAMWGNKSHFGGQPFF